VTAEAPAASGADLARIALRQAKEAARRNGTKVAKPKRTARRSRNDGRDPLPLSGVMQQWLVDNGWQEAANGGSLINRWPEIVGEERAAHWKAATYDETTKTLTVVCESDSWARMLSLVTRQIVADVNSTLPGTLTTIKIRKGVHRSAPVPEPVAATSPAPPTQTRPSGATPSAAYTQVRDRLRAAKADRDAAAKPYVRLTPDRIQADPDDHAEARYLMQDLEEKAARAADTHARALRRARQERAAGRPATTTTPRRTTGAA